jgi:hypothetical protein
VGMGSVGKMWKNVENNNMGKAWKICEKNSVEKIGIEKMRINDSEEVKSVEKCHYGKKNITKFYGKKYISNCVNSQVALVFTSIRQVNI